MSHITAQGMWNGRSVPEWVGKTPDSKPPAGVVDRIFLRNSKTCHISKREIRAGEAWQVEHIVPLWKGGENRETNMAPALVKAHAGKSAAEAAERAEDRSMRHSVYGIKKSKNPIPGSRNTKFKRKMDGSVVLR